MKKLLLGLILILASFAANAFDVIATYSWDSNPASDQVTKYQCEYKINTGAFIPCSADISPLVNSTDQVINVNSGDVITAHIRACNVIGCSSFTAGASETVPPNQAPSAPTGLQIVIKENI